jgi:hypothetical protein
MFHLFSKVFVLRNSRILSLRGGIRVGIFSCSSGGDYGCNTGPNFFVCQEKLKAFVNSLAGILITLLLKIPAISRLSCSGIEVLPMMEAHWNTLSRQGEQNSPSAVTKEKAAEIAVGNLFAGKCTSRTDSSNLGRHRRWQVRFFVLFLVSLRDSKISWNKSSFLTIGAILFFVLIPLPASDGFMPYTLFTSML